MYKYVGMLFIVACLVGCNDTSSYEDEVFTVKTMSLFEDPPREFVVKDVKKINEDLIAVIMDSVPPAISGDITIQKGDRVRVKGYIVRHSGHGPVDVICVER